MIRDKTNIRSLGGSKLFLIPSDIFKDSLFPYKEDDEDLEMYIEKGRVIIERIK